MDGRCYEQMIDTKRKEELSKSYLNAICAYVGIAFEEQFHDDDSIDAIIKKQIMRTDGLKFNAIIGVQLKSTSQNVIEDEHSIHYCLTMKNYNDLRGPASTPLILCVLFLPSDESQWLTHSVDELIIRKCMYWISLYNAPPLPNQENITIKIPKQNTVTPQSIFTLLQKACEGDDL